MARLGAGSEEQTDESDSAEELADDDPRREAFEQDPGREISEAQEDDDEQQEADDGMDNRRDAVQQEPDIPQGNDETEVDDVEEGRSDAVQQDPGRDLTGGVEDELEDSADNRREAVEQDPGGTNEQSGLGYTPGQSAAERGVEDLSDDQADAIRKQLAAGVSGLGPSDFELARNDSGELQARLSEEGVRESAASTSPTLDPEDFEVTEGGVSLTTQEQEQRFRADAARELGISQDDVTIVRDAEGDLAPLLSEEAERTAIENQLADVDGIAREDIETVERNGRIEGRLTEEALRTRAASQRDELDPQDIEVTVEDGERQAQLTDDAARDLLKQEVASQTNVEESDVRISRGEDGELLARYQPEQPDVAEDPISRAARSGVERIFGSKPPTQDDLLDGLNQGVGDILGVDIPTQGEVSDEFRELSQDELGVTPPTQQELLDDVQGGVEGATGVRLPTNEELTQPLQDRASDIAGTDLEQFADAETAAAAGLPFAAAEPTPLGEAALVGVVGTAAAAQVASEVGGPVNEEIRPEDLEGGAFSGGELPVQQPTRREIPVVDGQRNSELDVPLEDIRNQSEIDVPDSLDRSEIQITDDGEVTVPADFAGNVVIQRGETEEEEIERQQNSEDVIVQVPDEFIPDEQVTIGEEEGFVDEPDPTVDEPDTVEESGFDDDFFRQEEDLVEDDFTEVEPGQSSVEEPGVDIEDGFPTDAGAGAEPTPQAQLPDLDSEVGMILDDAQSAGTRGDVGQAPLTSVQPAQDFGLDLFGEPATSVFTNTGAATTGQGTTEPFDTTVDTGPEDLFEFQEVTEAPRRRRRTDPSFLEADSGDDRQLSTFGIGAGTFENPVTNPGRLDERSEEILGFDEDF